MYLNWMWERCQWYLLWKLKRTRLYSLLIQYAVSTEIGDYSAWQWVQSTKQRAALGTRQEYFPFTFQAHLGLPSEHGHTYRRNMGPWLTGYRCSLSVCEGQPADHSSASAPRPSLVSSRGSLQSVMDKGVQPGSDQLAKYKQAPGAAVLSKAVIESAPERLFASYHLTLCMWMGQELVLIRTRTYTD